jgi:hypothetical protein
LDYCLSSVGHFAADFPSGMPLQNGPNPSSGNFVIIRNQNAKRTHASPSVKISEHQSGQK